MARGRRIFILCPEWDIPAGGVRKIYRHVDVLSANGVAAAISHHKAGFRCQWFANKTPIVYPPECYPRQFDILVVPELYIWDLSRQTPGVPKIVFNQNAYQTFEGLTHQDESEPAPYARPDVLATIVVSEDSRRYLNYVFPEHRIYRIRHALDGTLFYYPPKKKRQIAVMPRKLPADSVQILNILEARGALAGVEVVKIEKRSEAETAAILRESLIFLSFATEEGWALPPMEAIACGCITIGYDGRGGREYFTPQYGFPMPADDIIGFASTVERVLKQSETNPQPLDEMTRLASQYIRSTYTQFNEEQDILRAWEQILQLPGLPKVSD